MARDTGMARPLSASDVGALPVPANDARLPHTYESAKAALANCARLDECKDWADKAAALASYAKQASDDEMMKMATRIRDRAIRRAGELLKQVEPMRGANQNIGVAARPKVETRKEVAAAGGLSPHQAKQAIRVAEVSEAEFERQVESDKPPTISQLAVQGIKRPAGPKPVINLKGRDPAEFNRSLHFVAELEEYASSINRADLDLLLPGLTPEEARDVRRYIAVIDAVHDKIIARI